MSEEEKREQLRAQLRVIRTTIDQILSDLEPIQKTANKWQALIEQKVARRAAQRLKKPVK
jgi:flagellar biosynthesis chaperone FliJ